MSTQATHEQVINYLAKLVVEGNLESFKDCHGAETEQCAHIFENYGVELDTVDAYINHLNQEVLQKVGEVQSLMVAFGLVK